MNLASATSALHLSMVLASTGVAIWSLEYLARFRAFRGTGIYGWSLLRYRNMTTIRKGTAAMGLDLLLRFPNVIMVLAGRALLAVLLVVFIESPHVRLVATLVIFATNVLFFNVWSTYRRGSDGMMAVLFGAMLLVEVGAERPTVVKAGLWFIALQACVSYCANGFSKLGKPDWNAGTAVLDILQNRVYGNTRAVAFLGPRPRFVKFLSWTTLGFECLFPLVLFTGWPGCLIFLSWGFLFHGASTYLMGLNSFFWAYVATYPALIWASLEISNVL